eukprot:scaffold6722_cov98-Cylindrotheca_fusiformis.AAC.1
MTDNMWWTLQGSAKSSTVSEGQASQKARRETEGVGADESGSPELGTKSGTTDSNLLLEADREDQNPVTLPVTPQVIDDVTSSPTSDTRLQGAKRSYVEVARNCFYFVFLTVAHLRLLTVASEGWATGVSTEGRCGRNVRRGVQGLGLGWKCPSTTKDGKALGAWVNNQRRAKRRRVLKEDRENRLNGAGLKWSFLASKGEGWDSMFDWLLEFIEERKKEDTEVMSEEEFKDW